MTWLFINIDEYIIDPIEEEFLEAMAERLSEEYDFFPSQMNKKHA